MDRPEGDSEFNEARAELFEVLGHQTRIRILQALSMKPMGFSELKRATEIESGGLLSFHLGKLGRLVKLAQDGDYTLSDEGREALRVIATIGSEERAGKVRPKVLNSGNGMKVAAVVFVILLVALGGFSLYQQQQIGALSKEASANLAGTTTIQGRSFWYMTLPLQLVSGAANGTVISFHGANFTLILPGSYPIGTTVLITGLTNGSSMFLTAVNGTYTTNPIEVFVTNGTVFCTSCTSSNKTGVPATATVTFTVKPEALTVLLLPKVRVTLSNGQSQNILWPQGSPNTIAYVAGGDNFWFTTNTNPIAGMSVNSQAGTVTFYVQVTG